MAKESLYSVITENLAKINIKRNYVIKKSEKGKNIHAFNMKIFSTESSNISTGLITYFLVIISTVYGLWYSPLPLATLSYLVAFL